MLVLPSRAALRNLVRAVALDRHGRRGCAVTPAPIDRVTALVDNVLRRIDPARMPWSWAEGLFLDALVQLDRHVGEARHRTFVLAFYDAHRSRGVPRIDRSDRCAPGLAALALFAETGGARLGAIARAVADYIARSPTTRGGGLNHFGSSPYARLYPRSMWVDSMMMYVVFAARWAEASGDGHWRDLAADHAFAFARELHDPETGLWKHAWFENGGHVLPGGRAAWLRGTGWAIAALAEIAACLPRGHARRDALEHSLDATARALMLRQGTSGLWPVLLDAPRPTYLETSGSALVASGMMRAARAGLAGSAAAHAGSRAYLAIVDRLVGTPSGPSLPAVSVPTMPYPACVYAWLPRRRDLLHGVAALTLAAVEHVRAPRPACGT
jgi:unsaturated rhamnogalacturonyl hydrolase